MADEPSTRFPFISLEKALEKAQKLFAGDRSGKAMAVSTAFELWGYSVKSSGGFQTTSALKGYGLIEDEGANADRRLKLTDAARRYFLDERDEVRAGMLADFAMKPLLFRALWLKDKWSEGVPADTVACSHLKLERNLNEQSARSALSIFKENVQFAGLNAAGRVHEEPLESGANPDAAPTPPPEMNRGRPMEPQLAMREAAMPLPLQAGDAPAFQIVGDRVVITANLDLKGLRKLGKQLKLLESMLTMEDEDEDLIGDGPTR